MISATGQRSLSLFGGDPGNQDNTMTTATNILETLNWSAPERGIQTRNGLRTLRKATATPAFWAAWRSDKAGLQAKGITCKPAAGNDWVVLWWTPDGETISTTAGSEQPAASGSAPSAPAAPAVVIDSKPLDLTVGGVQWSLEQQTVLRWFAAGSGTGNLVVSARAGTGKTFTITHGLAAAPERDMLYLVFNKKNQKEAEAKISDPRVSVMTLNGIGHRCILSVWRGNVPDDSVEDDRIDRAEPNIPDDARSAVRRVVDWAKNTFAWMPTVAELERLVLDREIFCGMKDDAGVEQYPAGRLAAIALKALKLATERDSAKRHSFNDQVWLSVVMGWVRAQYDLVVVDETQDMNIPQLEMVQKLVRKGGRVCVVGDQNQAIYGFRGAAQDGMAVMRRALNAAELPLTITRRCPKAVVEMAKLIVPDYQAAPEAPEGEIRSVDEVAMNEAVKIGDAILSRSNAPLMSACLSLLKRGIPARIEGRDIGRQLVGMVRKLKAKSVPDFLRKLARWEEKQLDRLDHKSKSYEGKAEALRDQRETLEAVAEGCANVAEIESRLLSLFQNSDDEGVKPAVVLSSVHKAKGLEWHTVYLLDWTFGKRKCKNAAEEQEERNIRYVAITRAKHTLALVREGGSPKVKENKDGTKEVAA